MQRQMFQGEEFMSSLLNTTQNEAQIHASTDFGVWLEIRAELEKSIVEQNYNQNVGKTVEIVKVC